MRHLCRDILPSDLQYLTDENIEEIGSTMTHVEKMRMQAALQALRGTKQRQPLHSLELNSGLIGIVARS